MDGIDLGFLWAPIYFRTSYQGQPVTESQRNIFTRLVKRIRDVVLKQSVAQDRPFLLSARVPSTVALCRKIGIKIESRLQEQLLDVISLGGGYITFDVPVENLSPWVISTGFRCTPA